jgi:hypothetical protein
VPRCRYLVIVDDLDYGRAFAFSSDAFGVHDLPDVLSSFARETVPHLDVADWRFGVVALGTRITERRRGSPETSTTPDGRSRFLVMVTAPCTGATRTD